MVVSVSRYNYIVVTDLYIIATASPSQGVSEINLLHDKLAASYRFRGPSAEWILPLHSSIASEDQRKVFSRPPNNIRKV